jgi:hypothetical protein
MYDSLQCLSPAQANFVIIQSYTVQEQELTIVLKNKQIDALQQESIELRKEVSARQQEIDLHIKQNEICKSDKVFLEGQLHKVLRGRRLFKTGFIIVGGFAVIEAGYIGLTALIKH